MSPLDVALRCISDAPAKYREDFPDWLRENFHIFEYFERSALQVSRSGFDHYSARTIVEVMRHRTNIREIGDGTWKLNNNRTPDMAELFLALHPELPGFFELRERRKEAA